MITLDNKNTNIILEEISTDNLKSLSRMCVALWPECTLEEELRNCERILHSDRETCFIARLEEKYIGFIYLSLRTEYVEGTSSSPVGYIEGIYVDPAYRKSGLGRRLVDIGEKWVKSKGCREYASDADIHNTESIAFHLGTGFAEAGRIICFRKEV